MQKKTVKIKVLLSKLGLDVHNRGLITVAKMLRDAGMEVIYLGNALPDEIINIAIQENADVIGVSSLGGAHLTLGKDLIDIALQKEVKESTLFIIGGIFSIEDHQKLKDIGFDEVFTAGATSEEIVGAVYSLIKERV
ncbi:MAG: cobalamin B12-binding domain-containing protein [Actinobacteria bacterium]|nr:cobalamin B12-binding domain-containing protein [Actinomycetota bacterium]